MKWLLSIISVISRKIDVIELEDLARKVIISFSIGAVLALILSRFPSIMDIKIFSTTVRLIIAVLLLLLLSSFGIMQSLLQIINTDTENPKIGIKVLDQVISGILLLIMSTGLCLTAIVAIFMMIGETIGFIK